MPAQQLRDYQAAGLKRILDAYKQGARSVLAVAPTGSGKTSLFTHLTSQVAGAGSHVVILVHRRELATQAAERLREFGVPFGYIMAGEAPNPCAKIQIASVQTLVRRRVPRAALVIADEAHLSTAATWQSIISQYPNARILGVTATPWRLGGKPLVGAYDACVVVAHPAELREQGYLCPYNGFSYLAPDLSKVKTTGGDYNEQQSAAAMSESVIVDTIVEEWLKHARDLSTVVFAVTVEHSKQLTEKFRAAGVAAEHLDGSMSLEQRRAILARVERGVTRVLCNVGVAVEGLDIPRLKCCVLARPTKSLARAIQMMGRVRRPWQGQTARIHDHAFVLKHGLPDDERDYSLNAKAEENTSALPSLTQCKECLALYRGSYCTACATPRPVGERELNTITDAEQFEFSSGDSPAVERPPVVVKWDSDGGKVIEGIFSKQWTEQREWGLQQTYLVKGKKRDYHLPGTMQLDRLMKRVRSGDQIRITQLPTTILNDGKTRKEFRLEKDEPEDPDKKRALSIYLKKKLSAAKVAAIIGRPVATVDYWVRAAKVSRNLSESHGGSESRDQRAAKLLKSLPAQVVAKRLGMSASAVYRAGEKFGVKNVRPAAPKAVDDTIQIKIRELRAAGRTFSEIAEIVGVSVMTAHRYGKCV